MVGKSDEASEDLIDGKEDLWVLFDLKEIQ